MHPGRNGYLWLLERRADGISFVDAKPFVIQEVFTEHRSQDGTAQLQPRAEAARGQVRHLLSRASGAARTGRRPAYNPKTGLFYIPANENLCSTLVGLQGPVRARQALSRHRPAEDHDEHAPGRQPHRRAAGVGHGHAARRCGPTSSPGRTGARCSPRAVGSSSWAAPTTGTSARSTPRPAAALGVQDQFRGHRRAQHLRGRRRAVHRRPVGLGGRRAADAGAARYVPRHQDRGALRAASSGCSR